MELRDYQTTTVEAVLNPPSGITRQLVVIATGGGKTVVFATILARVLAAGGRGLIIENRRELIEQAAKTIAVVDPSIEVEIEREASVARRHPDLFGADCKRVVIASVKSLHKSRLTAFAPSWFDFVVVDEAHHATAPEYLKILRHFGCFESTPLLGVTATPERSRRSENLGTVFQHLAASYGLADLVRSGYLVPIRCRRVSSAVDVGNVKLVDGDFVERDLAETVDQTARNGLIVEAYRHYGADRRAVAFCASVTHAKHLAEHFRNAGVHAEAIHGKLNDDERRAALLGYREGRIRVLTTYGVLIEGWDEPLTGVVILARPTTSGLLLTQMVGRGTRKADGKTDLLVIDVQDVTSSATLATSTVRLAGLPPDFDAQGNDIFRCERALRRLHPGLAKRVRTAADLAALLKQQDRGEIDLLAIATEDSPATKPSKFLWYAVDADRFAIAPDRNVRLLIEPHLLGGYDVTCIEKNIASLVGHASDRQAAFSIADDYLETTYRDRLHLLRRNAKWRKEPATPAQLALLRRHCVDLDHAPTKGEAARLLDVLFRRAS